MTSRIAIATTIITQLACTAAWADRADDRAVAVTRPPVRAPYAVELIGENGSTLPTYLHGGRVYTLGTAGERYTVRITNGSDQRIEAVISVDGLDVIDGNTADYTSKRGYVVPAYGQLRLDGFRVSQADVATFRFSSVDKSYAGRKGKARNVGVIGVAIFKEKVEEPVYLPTDPTPRRDVDYDYDVEDYGGAEESGADVRERAPSPPPKATADKPAAEAPARPSAGEGGGGGAPTTTARVDSRAPTRCCDVSPKPKKRPGLGTEFGERRSSHVRFVTFVRASSKPVAIVEIRYNDRAGLAALGIPVEPEPDEEEIELRETADPFPDAPYSEPPVGWR